MHRRTSIPVNTKDARAPTAAAPREIDIPPYGTTSSGDSAHVADQQRHGFWLTWDRSVRQAWHRYDGSRMGLLRDGSGHRTGREPTSGPDRPPGQHARRPLAAFATGRSANPGAKPPDPHEGGQHARRPSAAFATGRSANPGAKPPDPHE